MRVLPCCSVIECAAQSSVSRGDSHSVLRGFQQVRYAARERIPVQGIRLTVDKSQLPPVDSAADSSPWQRDGGFRVRVAGKSLQVCHEPFVASPFCLSVTGPFAYPLSACPPLPGRLPGGEDCFAVYS